MITLSALARRYLRVPVAARRDGLPVDLTADTVEFAFVDHPVDADWHSGTWETVDATTYARVLVGPGTLAVLTAGIAPVLVRVTDNPERPVTRVGYLKVV